MMQNIDRKYGRRVEALNPRDSGDDDDDAS